MYNDGIASIIFIIYTLKGIARIYSASWPILEKIEKKIFLFIKPRMRIKKTYRGIINFKLFDIKIKLIIGFRGAGSFFYIGTNRALKVSFFFVRKRCISLVYMRRDAQ